jgi:tRNA (cytidine/uridine-2'-O-)-methyltransferase
MFHVVLYRPEIPPNTGNAMRLCANTGTTLHLIHPLGFSLDEARLRRAGLDYRHWAEVRNHDSLEDFVATAAPERIWAFSQVGQTSYTEVEYGPGDALLFGPESDGLPEEILGWGQIEDRVRIPMLPRSRSLNLANALAIAVYEAWRQLGFQGGV